MNTCNYYLTLLGFIDDLDEGGGGLLELLNKLTGLDTSLQTLNLGSGHAGEFNTLGSDLLGVGSGADTDKVLGEAGFSLDLFGQMSELRLPVGINLRSEDGGDLGGDLFLLDTSLLFPLQFRLLLLGNSLALAILNHEGQSGKLRGGHHASSGRLDISSLFSVQVTAETSSLVSEDVLVGINLDPLAISFNRNSVLLGHNGVDSILRVGDIGVFIFVDIVGLSFIPSLLLLLVLLLQQLLLLLQELLLLPQELLLLLLLERLLLLLQ